jgi:hypothetical protein
MKRVPSIAAFKGKPIAGGRGRAAVLSDLLHHSANKGKTVRRMPDLDPQQ